MTDLGAIVGQSPFHRLLGIEALSQDPETGTVRMGLALRPEIWRSDGEAMMHGGAIAALIDVAAVYAVRLVAGRGGTTVALSVDYLRPVRGTRSEAVARVIRSGRTQALADVELFDGDRLAAVGRARFALTGEA